MSGRDEEAGTKPGLPRRIVVATRNAGKMREIRALLAEIPTQLLSLEDLAEPIQLDEPFDSFWANARHKASKVAAATGEWGLADDSGLEVDALDGWPGVRSARSAGRCAGDADRVAVLLQRLGDVPAESRTARFVCVIALASPSGEVWQWRGTCEGVIAAEPRGSGGFGFDPVFFVPAEGKTMAELPLERKNEISHRARALRQLREALRSG